MLSPPRCDRLILTRQRGVAMDSMNDSDRYLKHILFPGIGEAGQKKLGRSNVVVVGCGGLGSTAAGALARAGIGRLRIIDRDLIEYHNLHRQVLYDEEDVKQRIPKAVAAERHLRAANSSIEVEGVVADVNNGNVEKLVEGADVIVDGLDNLEGRYLINDASLKLGVPWVYGAAVSSLGMTMAILPGRTPCIRCLFSSLPPPETRLTSDTAGILNAVPMVVGALQAAEAIKVLLGQATPGLLTVDLWSGEFDRLAVGEPSPDCPACQGRYEFLDARSEVQAQPISGGSHGKDR
jgi:molybdopterin/thiamine biosynthesis adenylyltransferase